MLRHAALCRRLAIRGATLNWWRPPWRGRRGSDTRRRVKFAVLNARPCSGGCDATLCWLLRVDSSEGCVQAHAAHVSLSFSHAATAQGRSRQSKRWHRWHDSGAGRTHARRSAAFMLLPGGGASMVLTASSQKASCPADRAVWTKPEARHWQDYCSLCRAGVPNVLRARTWCACAPRACAPDCRARFGVIPTRQRGRLVQSTELRQSSMLRADKTFAAGSLLRHFGT